MNDVPPLRLAPLLIALVLALPLAGCGGSDSDAAENLTPEGVAAKLQEEGYVTGEPITDGANVGVAKGGKLDAEAYLSVDADPDGAPLYGGIYFFETPEQAAVLAKEREPTEDRDFNAELVGSLVYEVAGDPNSVHAIIAAVEAP